MYIRFFLNFYIILRYQNLEHTYWFRLNSKSSKNSAERNRIFNLILIFFQIFTIRFGRIELAYPNKPLKIQWISMLKRLLSSVKPNWIMKIWKKIKNSISFGRFFLIRFDFDLVRIKFDSFTAEALVIRIKYSKYKL